MNINVESQEAILSRDIVIVPKIAKKASKINYINVKRIFDLVISTIGLIVLSPIFLILAIIVKLDSKGPVFFAHTRYGKNGKKFKMYKFRTMYENAQDMINDFTPEQMKEWKENFKLQDDPRITKVGKFLRKTSLDELPQIVNIMKGDLSIIGPRPVIEEELKKYGENKEKFLSVTPGLTGYWQANGRSSTTYEQRMEMELYYIDHISPKLDFKIFFKTIESVIKKEGAI
ncbi:MAG: exopolysaccharide biosynthesis protein [Clostridium sp. 27_14]|nr:MAG: exopolysaccharide biosynthesis protein [Clostridium sp. 27_14]